MLNAIKARMRASWCAGLLAVFAVVGLNLVVLLSIREGTTLSPDFNVNAEHQVPGMLSIPLASFPTGDYRLEIKVTDKSSNKSITQSVAFTVAA